MKKGISKSLIVLSMACVLSLPLNVSAKSGTVEVISPSTETLINGVPESQVRPPIQTNDVIVGPIFDSYVPSYTNSILKHRKIASYSHDNTRSTVKFPMSVTVTSSTQQGSDFSGSITFTGTIKAGIFGGIEVSNGYEVKETRVTNEAVGVTAGPLEVPAGKWGYIDLWYKAVGSGGGLRTYTYNTSDPTKKFYITTPINVKVYKKDFLEVHSESRIADN